LRRREKEKEGKHLRWEEKKGQQNIAKATNQNGFVIVGEEL